MFKLGFSASALAIMLMCASAARAADETYDIHVTLLHQGSPFATPVMTVQAGEHATIETTGPDAFKLALTATPIDADTVQIAGELESAHGSALPTLIVKTGELATITAGAIGLELLCTLRSAAAP